MQTQCNFVNVVFGFQRDNMWSFHSIILVLKITRHSYQASVQLCAHDSELQVMLGRAHVEMTNTCQLK